MGSDIACPTITPDADRGSVAPRSPLTLGAPAAPPTSTQQEEGTQVEAPVAGAAAETEERDVIVEDEGENPGGTRETSPDDATDGPGDSAADRHPAGATIDGGQDLGDGVRVTRNEADARSKTATPSCDTARPIPTANADRGSGFDRLDPPGPPGTQPGGPCPSPPPAEEGTTPTPGDPLPAARFLPRLPPTPFHTAENLSERAAPWRSLALGALSGPPTFAQHRGGAHAETREDGAAEDTTTGEETEAKAAENLSDTCRTRPNEEDGDPVHTAANCHPANTAATENREGHP